MEFRKLSPLAPEFTFAGFSFPRYIACLPKRTPAIRLKGLRPGNDWANYGNRGTYHMPTPVERRADKGFSSYMTACDIEGLRYVWADEVEGSHIHHNGWFCDEWNDETLRGVVIRLPHGRYLAGWGMGIGMCCSFDADIYDDEAEAAQVADDLACYAAEEMRDERASEREEAELEEAQAEEFRATMSQTCQTLEALAERIASRMSSDVLR